MTTNIAYLYLLSPLHTGGTSQEGNLVGIARESHTNLPYIPSSTIRGRQRANLLADIDPKDEDKRLAAKIKQVQLFGPDLQDIQKGDFVEFYNVFCKKETERKLTQLEQGSIWVGDGSILWLPVPSLSHGVVWVSSNLLLQRWARLTSGNYRINVPEYSSNLSKKSPVYLKDAILKGNDINVWEDWQSFIPASDYTSGINQVLILPDRHCQVLIQMSLWRQVKVKLNEHKTVEGGFRYEEAIPPDTLMYFPWGITAQATCKAQEYTADFTQLLNNHQILQIGGQESLGRGFVQQWIHNQD